MSRYMKERSSLVEVARTIFRHGLSHGRTGNASIRVPAGFLVTPTGCSLESVLPEELSLVDLSGAHLDGPRPSKEAFLHAAMLRARPNSHAVVHTHSIYAAAVSCLDLPDGADALPPLTAYYAMRVDRLPLLPYFAPGDDTFGPVAESAARESSALLLRNHGPIVAAPDLSEAMDAIEEIEVTAHLHLLIGDRAVRPLTDQQRRDLAGGPSARATAWPH
jgi:ribulose-5-phosphate 4-epimerase/fuculose-1-phosphate aldolase